jgi:signal transduction histidine kinase
MSEPVIAQNEEESLQEEDIQIPEPFAELKQSLELKSEAAILCEVKERNPNYLAIIHANKKFYEIFDVSEFNLIGKNYDFLFDEFDLDYSSEDQMEYVRLIKSVKDFHPCSLIVRLDAHALKLIGSRFKVSFEPVSNADETSHHAIFTFEKMEIENLEAKNQDRPNTTPKSQSVALLQNLERTLRSERLLREVGSLIITDLPIQEVAQKIAKILCEHLRADRCLLHDYDDSSTNFIIEYRNSYTKEMVSSDHNEENLKMLGDYVNFQNHFFRRYGSKDKKSWVAVIDDIPSDQNFLPIAHIYENFFITSQIAVTTTFNGKVNGGIYIHQSDKRNWLEEEIELIENVADQFSIALDRSASIERVMVANHALLEKTSQLKEALKHEQEIRKMQNEFVALVSHEFKTPLQIIDSTRELLVRKIKNHNILDESLDKALERIRSGIQRMNGLIHSTLNLAKMESGDGAVKLESEIFNLKEFILEIIERNSNLASNKQIKIVTKINELPTDFYGDRKLLDHSITNVISNAVKYSKNNTVVKILAKTNDKKVALRIIDQGMGIPKDDLANIGKKFFRAKNTLAVAGTGIGIYLTKHFIELHGGDVLIESEVDVGTSVTITIPRVEPAQAIIQN